MKSLVSDTYCLGVGVNTWLGRHAAYACLIFFLLGMIAWWYIESVS